MRVMGDFLMTATGIFSSLANARRLRGGVATVALSVMLGSCAGISDFNDFDTGGGITKGEYEQLLGRRGQVDGPVGTVDGKDGEPPIPGFQSVIAAPTAPELADTRRVSISVTETTPVRDIVIELARKAGVDLELDPRISGGIIMSATDRPFIEVIERIAELAELRFRFDRNTLRVDVDDPYLEQYRMDVLNLSRQSSSSVSSSTDAASSAQAVGAGGGGGDNKSATSVTSTTSSDFWSRIGGNIEQILAGTRTRRDRSSAPAVAATFVPEEAPPAVEQAAAPAPTAGGAATPESAAAALAPAAAPGAAGGPAPLAAGRSAAGGGGPVASAEYSLNPEAGIITVHASQRQQRAVERYLREVRASVTQQILIEAKIVEVTLNDQYRAGVNWNAVFGPNSGLQDFVVGTNFTRDVVPPEFSDATFTASWTNGADLDLAVQMVKQFGTVRTLSSPRLTALNNQVAQLKVARNQVFFELDVTFTEGTVGGARDKIQVESQIKTVPVGMVMSVQPAVDPISGRISLSLRPSITRITGFVNDPGVAVAVSLAQDINPNLPLVTSPIPIIEVRELDSILNMESGQTVVMGGLMQETGQTTREGFPGLMDIPLLGQAAAQNIKQNTVTELVIFIRATLANGAGTIADEDIRLYKTFTPDPRPIVF